MTKQERATIKSLDKCDFSVIHAYLKKRTEERKAATKEEKQVLALPAPARVGVWVCGCVGVSLYLCVFAFGILTRGGGKACTNDDCTVCFTFPFAHAGVHSRSLALVEKERGERKAEGGVWLCHHGWPKVRHTSHAFFL